MSSPLGISKRPFAVEPLTGIMLPDGIFDVAISRLLISVYLENTSPNQINHFFARIHDTADYAVTGPREFQVRDPLVSGVSTLLQWEVTFKGALPGKKILEVESGGMSISIEGKEFFWDGFTTAVYFLSSTRYDGTSNQYFCTVPEGSLGVTFNNSLQSPSTRPLGELTLPPVQFPQRFTAVLTPTDLGIPFQDPWWKIVAWIIAALAGIGALIAAKEGSGAAQVGISGHGHDNPVDYEWCVPDPAAFGKDNYLTPAGILSTIANAAILVGLSDTIDPWERGRQAAGLAAGEQPLSEVLEVELFYPDEMVAGMEFSVGARWTYRATLNTGRVTALSVDETQPNSHLVTWEFDAPTEALASKPILVKLRGTKPSGEVFVSDELYGFALFITPDGQHSFRVPLLDDGGRFDAAASDGWYTAGLLIEEQMAHTDFDPYGEWRVQFIVQDVNDATPDMPPTMAATHVGGALLMAPISASQTNGSACTVAEIIRVLVKKFL